MASSSAAIAMILALSLLPAPLLLRATAERGGFSVQLIHRDSPNSPFYDPRRSLRQRMTDAFHRSFNRHGHHLRGDSADVNSEVVRSEITANRGEYLMNISIGTPPFQIRGIADTGSDLVWMQCKPCEDCYEQEAPLFNPRSSSTYKDLSCSSRQCQASERTSCRKDNKCMYATFYGDRSFSQGNLAVDTVTLDSTSGRSAMFSKTTIGCGHQNGGSFNDKASGIIGLGGGPFSLVSQIGDTIARKFSYCLVPFPNMSDDTTSTINFGSRAVVSGPGAVSTPLVQKTPKTFYFLTLEAISIGRKRIEFSGSSYGADEGNVIIDSGTTLTFLPSEFYAELEFIVAAQIDAERVDDPSGFLSLCYSASSNLTVPPITVHFSGADVELKRLNTFVPASEDVVCFAFAGFGGNAIYGNVAQMDFHVGYDMESHKVSFQPTDCARI